MKGIKVIVFDFDGVIVRLSDLIKAGAWGFVANHPDIGSRVAIAMGEEYSRTIQGNRIDTLEFTFKHLGWAEEKISALIEKHAKRYNDIVQEGIRALGVNPEDRKAICDLRKRYNLYINSGTVEKELNETVESIGLIHYFKGVYGQPSKKVSNLERVMLAEGVTPKDMLFIGDSDSDYAAAQEFECRFLGLANKWNGWVRKEKPFTLIFGISDIQNYLE